jgi:dTDP-4-amino-4,6-dideoxygalactose transaminase
VSSKTVRFHDPAQRVALRGAVWEQALKCCIRELEWTRPSTALARFEEELAAFCGVRHAVATASGSAALQLALLAAGAGSGTRVATVGVARLTGAEPTLVDIERESYTMSPASIAGALPENTRVILPVHLYGRPAQIAEIVQAAGHVPVVEEACQAIGAGVDGRPVGGLATAAVFSFGREKAVAGLGEGGAVTTDDDDFAALIRSLGNQGRVGAEHVIAGTNARMDPLEATVLRIELAHAVDDLAIRREIASKYTKAFAPSGIVKNPLTPEGVVHGHYTYVVEVRNRSAFCDALTASGVEWRIHYSRPVHGWPPYRDMAVDLPVTENVAQRVVSLPLRPTLTDSDVERVINAVGAAVDAVL